MIATALVALAVAAEPACSNCHEAQAAEWRASAHAAALDAPLYRGMREWAHADAGEAASARCAACHSVASGEERTAGVTCEVCHQGAPLDAGPAALRVDTAAPVRASRAADAPHPVRVDAALASGAVCLTCHAELRTPAGVAVCTTGPEVEGRPGGPGCVTCHMRDGHRFSATSPDVLARAAQLSLDVRGAELLVAVVNRGAGHALPTGSAMRQVALEVAFLDARGRRLRAAGAAPVVFARLLADAEGSAPVPPWRATAVLSDTRLAAGERRTVAVPIPAGAALAEARLVYRRAPAPVLARLGLADSDLAAPVTMALARVPLPGD